MLDRQFDHFFDFLDLFQLSGISSISRMKRSNLFLQSTQSFVRRVRNFLYTHQTDERIDFTRKNLKTKTNELGYRTVLILTDLVQNIAVVSESDPQIRFNIKNVYCLVNVNNVLALGIDLGNKKNLKF
jgi:hypothetical protein